VGHVVRGAVAGGDDATHAAVPQELGGRRHSLRDADRLPERAGQLTNVRPEARVAEAHGPERTMSDQSRPMLDIRRTALE
jgi:hypothetical protein